MKSDEDIGLWKSAIPISVIGFSLVFVPAVASPDYPNSMDEWFNPFLLIGFAMVVGIGLKILDSTAARALWCGCAVMALFPIWSFVDSIFNPGAHTLIAIELVLYLGFALATGVASVLGYFAAGVFR